MKGLVFADSSAALAIAKRKGAGKLRHIHVSSLWIQDQQDREETEFRKILGTENPAHLMTKYLTRGKMDACLVKISQQMKPRQSCRKQLPELASTTRRGPLCVPPSKGHARKMILDTVAKTEHAHSAIGS